MSASTLYDEKVMDHIKHARHYRVLEQADRKCEAVSQVCGDSVTVYLRLGDNRLRDIGFQCVACGICMASASMMAELVHGQSLNDVSELITRGANALEGGLAPGLSADQQSVFVTLQAFPSRKTCAWVGWAALAGALRGESGPVSL